MYEITISKSFANKHRIINNTYVFCLINVKYKRTDALSLWHQQ